MSNGNRRRGVLLGIMVAGAMLFLAFGVESLPGQGGGPKPASHWVFDSKEIKSLTVKDQTGSFHGKLTGSPLVKNGPPASYLELHGSDGVVLKEYATGAEAGLPREKMTAAAWVRIDEGTTHGGIIGCLQDNGDLEKGWLLGYDREKFTFSLSSKGADDGDGKLTTLRSKTPFSRGKWQHVAATYDGKSMRLFINGKADSQTADQSGPILYPNSAPFTLGQFRDDDETYGMRGALREVQLFKSALAPDLVAALFQQQATLADEPAISLPPAFVIAPYLQYPTRDAITVMWETTEPGISTVRHGEKLPLELQVKGKSASIHEITLKGLKPNTKYFYQVETLGEKGGVTASGILTFQTAVDEDKPFTFGIIGDTQKNPSMTGKVMRLIWERRPHFLMHVGDVVDNGPDKKEWVNELFRPSAELLCRVPVLPTIGNHEKNHEHYYQYFSLPGKEFYYKLTYGNADFFSIDSNKPLLPGSEQFNWLNKELGESRARWKFVFHHHPAFSSDDNDFGDSWNGAAGNGDKNVRWLVPLYEKHGVDVVFNGHVHVYERTFPIRAGKVDPEKGVIYVTSGGGGGKLEDFQPTPVWFKAEVRSDFHFCQVSIVGGRLNLKAFDHQGRLFDNLDIRK